MEFLKNFTKIVTETPNRTAVVDMNGSRRTTYAELDEMSGKAYGYLKKKGIGREDFVAVSLPRGVAPVAAMLGVMKAGAAYVMIEEVTPPERSAFIIKDCGCRMHITPGVWKEIESEESLSGFEEVDDHDAAFVVYTSGTTGAPKGVVHEFGNVDRIIDSHENSGKLTIVDYDAMAMLTPISFVAANIVTYITLAKRVVLHVVPLSVVKDPKAFEEYLADQSITGFFASPTLYGVLNNISPTLRLVFLSSELIRNIWSPDRSYCVMYTSSELAVIFAYFIIDRSYDLTPIGKPSDKFKYKIIDDAGSEVPEGEIGELCVENPYVRGYLNLPELSTTAFEKDRMYHTGDLVRRLPDGKLVVVGRKDDMIKIAGNRVEPAEIEAAAKKVLNISECVAKGFSGGNNTYICLYYTGEAEIIAGDACKKLLEVIPNYMLPSYFIKLDNFPKNANGKIDKKALPLPERRDAECVPPADPIEKKLLEEARALLGSDKFGVTDDLFQCGMNSLLAMKFAAAIHSVCPMIRVANIMSERNIRSILKGTVRIFRFYKDYDPDKPVLVFIHGLFMSDSLIPKYDEWSKYFNIFIIEPTHEHYRECFGGGESFADVIEFYSLLLDRNLPADARVFAFMGFSFGGLLAAYMAEYRNRTHEGELPAVVMGDTWFIDVGLSNKRIKKRIIDTLCNQGFKRDVIETYGTIEAFGYAYDVMCAVIRDRKRLVGYEGPAVFMRSGDKGFSLYAIVRALLRANNMRYVHKAFTNLQIIDFPQYNHTALGLDQSLNKQYTEILLRLAERKY